MGIILRQSFKGTIVSYIGVLIGVLNVLWFFPKFLLPEQIGLLRLLQDIPLLLGSFIQLGASNVADRFYPYFKTKDGTDHGFFFLLIIYPLFGFLLFVLLFFVFYDYWISLYYESSPLLAQNFLYILPLAFFVLYISIFEAYARVNQRIVVPGIFREVVVRVLISLIIILYFLNIFSWKSFLLFFVLIYGLSLLFLLLYIRQLKKLNLKTDFKFLTKDLVKHIFSFVFYIIPGTAGSLVASKIDTLMLGAQEGLANTGIYSIAFFIGAVVEMPKRALSQISIPILSQSWKNNDLKTIDTIYKKSSINQLIVGFLLFLCIWVNIDDLFMLIPHNEIYRSGKYVVLFVGISKLFDMATGVNSEIILSSRYYRFNLIAMLLLSVTTVVANYILIPVYNITGAAISLALTIFLFNLIKFIFIWMVMKMQPFGRKTLYVLIISLIAYLGVFWIPSLSGNIYGHLGMITIRCTLIIILILCPVFYYKISEDFNNFIIALLKRIREGRLNHV